MAEQKQAARTRSSSKRTTKDRAPAENGRTENGDERDAATDEKELANYLRDRIRPGLNRGSIPLLARSIAKEIARGDYHGEASDDDDESEADADEKDSSGSGNGEAGHDLQTSLLKLQQQLGDEWILYFAVQGDDTWLTAEKEDASQRIEAPTAAVLAKAVKILNDGGGRSRS